MTQNSSDIELKQSTIILQQFSQILVAKKKENCSMRNTENWKKIVLGHKIEVMAEDTFSISLCMKMLGWDLSHILEASHFSLSGTEKVNVTIW